MLLGTYQPIATLIRVENLEQEAKDCLGDIADDLQSFKPAEPKNIWCFPARSWREAFTHSLLTAPNCPQAYIVIDTDNYRRIDKVAHYAMIAEGVAGNLEYDPELEISGNENPACADNCSEFVVPFGEFVKSVRAASVCHPVVRGVLAENGEGNGMSFLDSGGTLRWTDFEHPEPITANKRKVASKIMSRASGMLAPGAMNARQAMEHAILETGRLIFMFADMPFLHDTLGGASIHVSREEAFHFGLSLKDWLAAVYGADHLLQLYSRMGEWSYGACEREPYFEILADIGQVWKKFDILWHYASKGVRPERNEKCPCGSGLKYKKCCARIFNW